MRMRRLTRFGRVLVFGFMCSLMIVGITPRVALAAPTPSTTIAPASIQVFPGESFTFDVTFENSATSGSGDVGYNPAIEIVLPPGVSFNSATSAIFGSLTPVQTTTVPGSGQVTNSLTGEVVTGLTAGSTYLLFQLPVGSYTPDQVPDTITIDATTSATIFPDEQPINPQAMATGIFVLGDSPTGNTPIRQSPSATADIVPVLYIPYKDAVTRFGEDETATGPNFPITYTLGADIAAGASITNLVFSEELPDNLQFSGITGISLAAAGDPTVTIDFTPEGGSATTLYTGALSGAVFPIDGPSTPAVNDPGGTLVVTLSVASGTTGANDVEIEFEGFVPEFAIDDTTPIIDPTTGGDVPVTNTLETSADSGTGPFGTIDLSDPVNDKVTDPVTIQARNFAIQKDVAILTDNNVAGLSSSDVVQFTLQVQISDYFQHDQIAIQDVLGDGYDYNAGSSTLTFLTENGTASGATPVSFTDQAQDPALDISSGAYPAPLPTGTVLLTQNAQPGESSGTTPGFTTLTFDVSGLSAGGPIGLLTGGAFNGDASGADGYTTGVDDETRLSITFNATIQDEYENPSSYPDGDASIDSFDVLANDVLLSGRIRDSLGGGDFDTEVSSETQEIAEPSFTKALVARNGSAPGPDPINVFPGDTLTFELRVDVPTGHLEELSVTDFLPLPIIDATEITTFTGVCAGFPAAGDACYGPGTTTPPSGTNPGISTSGPENSVTFTWPDDTTFDPGPPQSLSAVVHFTVTVNEDPFADNLFLTNVALANFGNSAPDGRTATGTATFVLREPVIDIVKDVSPTTADAGDTVTYTITATNTGGYDAYDVGILDDTFATLPLSGCGVISVEDENGLGLPTSGDLFVGPTGLVVTTPIAPGGEIVVTVSCTLTVAAEPEQDITNTSEITQFFNEDTTDGNRTNFVDPTNPPSDDATVTPPNPGIVKTITGTNQTFTTGNNVAIGEVVSYQVVITVPEGTSTNVIFRDTLDRGLAYVDGTFSAASSNATDMPISPSAPVYTNPTANTDQVDGRLQVDFGTVVNNNTDNGTAETITITYDAVVINNSTNNSGTNINNDAEWYWDGGSTAGGCNPGGEACVQTSAPNVTVQEAAFSVTKTANVTEADAGDTVTYTIVVDNTGNTTAHEVAFSDIVPSGLTYVGGTFMNTAGLAPDTISDADPTGAGLSATWSTFSSTDTSTFTFQATVDAGLGTGTVIDNTATVTWSSLPGDVPAITTPNGNTFACERSAPDDATTCAGGDASDDYEASGSDDITVFAPALVGKSLISTSETQPGDSDPGDANLGANPPVQIGEVLTYEIAFEFPEAVTPASVLADVLEAPAADGSLVLIGATLERNSTGLTMANNPGGINAAAVDAPVDVFASMTDGANEYTLDLGDVTNSDTDGDAEILTLTVQYRVANIALNSAGETLTDHGELRFGPGTTIQTSPVSVHVAEPIVDVQKVAIPSSVDGGTLVTFTITITNNAAFGGANSASGFDWTITDPLPAEYTSPSVSGTDAMGTGAVINASFTGNTLNVTIDELNPGESVEVEYQATVDPTVEFGEELTNTVNAQATSLRADSDPNERTGAGGVNDLEDMASQMTVAGLPNISKSITPLSNPYAIGEVATFEIRVGAPVGSANNFVVTDLLDSGLIYAPGSLSVVLPGSSSATNTPLNDANATFFDYDAGSNTISLDFGTLTIDTAGDVVITYGAIVENILANQTGTAMANSASLSFDDPNDPGNSTTAGPATPVDNVIVGEPNIELTKTINAGAVGATAGDTVSWEVAITNSGNTTAYQLNWVDVMPDGPNGPPDNDGLYNISNTGISISGGSVFLNNTSTPPTTGDLTISTTTNPNDTISLAPVQIDPGATITITFDTVVGDQVQPGQVLVNDTDVDYASLPVDTGNERDGDDGGDDDNPTPLNNYNEDASESLTIGAAIAIDKTVSPTTYTIGELVTYEVVVSVIQGTTADLVVTDTLPAGLAYDSHSIAFGCFGNANLVMTPGNPSYNDRLGSGQTVQFDFGDLDNPDDSDSTNDCLTISITALVENVAGNVDGVVLGNNAQLTYTDANNNTQTVDFDADPGTAGIQPLDITIIEPALGITKTVDPTDQALGDLITFTVRVEHLPSSTADAYDIQIIDTLPTGLTYEPGSAMLPAGGTVTPSGQDLTFEFASLTLADNFVEFTYQARIDITAVVGTPLTNDARLTWASLPGATGAQDSGRTGADGPGGALNDYAAEDDATVTPTSAAFITIDKTVADITDDPDLTLSGDILEYTVVIENTNGPVTGVVATDPIPVGAAYVDGSLTVVSGNGTADDSGDPLVVTIGDMSPGDVTTFTFQVRVDDFTPNGTVIENTATVDSDQTVPTSDEANRPVGVPQVGDLRAEKRVMISDDVVAPTDGTINVGDEVTYTITIINTGQVDLTNLVFNDTLPAGVDVTSAAGANWSCNVTPGANDAVACNYLPGTLPVGGTATISIVADVLQVSSGEPTGTWVNQGTATTDETGPRLTDGNADPNDGEQPTQFPVLADGETGTPAIDVWKSVAIVLENNGDGLLNPGETIRYTITVVNAGSAPVTNATLTDDIPADTTLIAPGVTTDTGVVVNPATQPPPDQPAPLTIDINIGTIPVGGLATITIDLLVNPDIPTPGVVSNQAFADFEGNPGDPVPSDDPDTPDVDDPTDLPVDIPSVFDPPSGFKTVDPAGYPALTWQMVWINDSNLTATNTRVIDPIPADTTYIDGSVVCMALGASTTVACEYDEINNQIIWEGSIAPDPGATGADDAANEVIITYQTTVAPDVTEVQNQACAHWDDDGDGFIGGPDGDPDELDQEPVCTDDPATTDPNDPTFWRAPDLTIEKSRDGVFLVGQQGAYLLTVSNVGAGASFNTITVTDVLPAGLEFVSASGTDWTCSYSEGARTITCTTDAIVGPGASLPPISVVVDIVPEAFPSVTNPASVEADGDLNPDNDNDDDTVTFVGPDLEIDKSHTETFLVGQEASFQLVVTNVGPEPTFETITVTDAMPSGVEFVSATGDGWTCSYNGNFDTVTCTSDVVLQPGESAPPITLTVIATANAFPSFVNTALVDTEGDENPANDDDDDEVDVSGGPDLMLIKSHETDFTIGSQNSYTISVTNVGAAATVLPTIVTDDVPSELVVVTAGGSGWECEVIGQLVECEYADAIEPGETVSFEIVVFVTEDAAGEVINTATVDNPNDENPGNDDDDDRTDILPPDGGDDGAAIWDGETEPGLLCTEECSAGSIFFPWVANDDDFGLGPADTSVTIQNLEAEDAYIFVYRGVGDDSLPGANGWDLVGVAFLSRYASKTFTAEQLGLAPGEGAPIAVAAYNEAYTSGSSCSTLIGGPLEAGNDVNDNDLCTDFEVPSQVQIGPDEYIDVCLVDNASGDPAPFFGTDGDLYQDRNDLPEGVYPAGLNADGDCNDSESVSGGTLIIDQVAIGGYAKQASGGENLPYTTAIDEVVDGYNAVSCHEIREFDDWYLPIVQTNVGPGGAWNTIIRVANYGNYIDDGAFEGVGSAAITLRFFPADDGSGSLNTGFQIQELVNAGDTLNINLADWVPEGWVGSVHIYSDGAIFAMADRFKDGDYKVWLTTTGTNPGHEATYNQNQGGQQIAPYVLFAPDVRLDFFGWNTGINVANLVNEDNDVTIQYFNLYGNAPTTLTRRLGPQGMTYFYDPSNGGQNNSSQEPTQDLNAGIVGSALIWSDYPVAVAVDATKYPESDPNAQVGRIQGTTYNATANVYKWQAVPLVQKGNPATGMGPTSGINIMNPNNVATQATVHWFNPSGAPADNFGTSTVAIPAYANGFVYTLAQGNLPNGYYGSAIVTSTYPVAATSAQVDYQVAYDGAVIWNAYNPGGFYRVSGCYEFGPVFEQPNGGQITKIFRDETGAPVTGVSVTLYNDAAYAQIIQGAEDNLGIPWVAVGVSNVNGQIEWTNVPEGNYWLQITGVPQNEQDADMYAGIGTIEGPYKLDGGQDLVIENELGRKLAAKTVMLGDDASGVEVCLHYDADNDAALDENEESDPVACKQSNAAGEASFGNLEPGRYWVNVNSGHEFPTAAGINAGLFGPEVFHLGGIYVNDLRAEIGAEQGNLQKVLVLPDEVCGPIRLAGLPDDCNVSISGTITFIGPDGTEIVGNVQTDVAGPYGPDDSLAYALTDFSLPVGGPYIIEEDLTITYDLDGPGGDAPVSVSYTRTLATAEDGQVVCSNYDDPTSDCEAASEDPEIYVYGESATTRVFNDLTGIITGRLDVFIRDDVDDQPLQDAEVCLYDASSTLIDCVFTDADGQAEFDDLIAGVYTITASAPDHEVDSVAAFVYLPVVDTFLGGGIDDELGDYAEDRQQDIEMALDPRR